MCVCRGCALGALLVNSYKFFQHVLLPQVPGVAPLSSSRASLSKRKDQRGGRLCAHGETFGEGEKSSPQVGVPGTVLRRGLSVCRYDFLAALAPSHLVWIKFFFTK